MKNIISGLLFGCILLIATTGYLKAQGNKVALNSKTSNFDPGAVRERSSIGILPDRKVTIRAVRDFLKQFRQADRVNWYKVRDGYIVKFFENGDYSWTAYDSRGNWIYNIVSYPENKLPRDVWHLVKSQYYDFSITWVNEILRGSKNMYIIHLKNEYSFQNVKVSDGELEVIEQFVIEPLNK